MVSLLGIGALALALAACGETRAPRYWVADRAAGSVLALDAELCVLERFAFSGPGLIAAGPDGLWIASALDERDPRPRRLTRVDPGTGAATASDFSALVALETDGRGALLALDRSAAPGAADTLLWRVAADHRRTLLGAFPRARALAAGTDAILVGCGGGELVLLRPDGAVLTLAAGLGPVHALARGPHAGEWWSLEGGGERTLRLLDRDLAPLRSARAPPGTNGFLAVEGAELAWLAAGERVYRAGASGVVELDVALPAGPWEVARAAGSRVLLRSPGALVEVEFRHGVARVRRTQGGFASLVALAAR